MRFLRGESFRNCARDDGASVSWKYLRKYQGSFHLSLKVQRRTIKSLKMEISSKLSGGLERRMTSCMMELRIVWVSVCVFKNRCQITSGFFNHRWRILGQMLMSYGAPLKKKIFSFENTLDQLSLRYWVTEPSSEERLEVVKSSKCLWVVS